MFRILRSGQEGFVSLKNYIWGWISLGFRIPAALKNIKLAAGVDSRNRESWGTLLEKNAKSFPDRVAIKSENLNLTYKKFNEYVNCYAHYFLSQGIKKGNVAVLFLENRLELLVVYSAIAKIGAINSMINTNLHREPLLNCLNLNPGNIFVIGEEKIDVFEDIRDGLKARKDFKLYFLPDLGKRPMPQSFIHLKTAVLGFSRKNPSTTASVTPKDPIAYVFTSGTTGGLSKAAIITHGRTVRSMYYYGKAILNIKSTDTLYVPLPFFHTNVLTLSWPCAFAGGAAIAIRRKFSAGKFWDDVKKHRATVFCYVGELCRYLMNRPSNPDDQINMVEKVIGNGLRAEIWKDFKFRFNIRKVYEIYGAAESNISFANILNLDCTVGKSRNTYAIVKYDLEEEKPLRGQNGFMQKVKTGERGLLIGEITEKNPLPGYTSRDATEAAILRDVFRNGDEWFNTGDLVRDIGFKHIRFVDRVGDTFRWKGENVSTTEVEKVVHTFPQVKISAAYGVILPGTEGRAGMAAVIPEEKNQKDFDLIGLAGYFKKNLPFYAVPLFIRISTGFQYTATHKIKKNSLKTEGFNPEKISDPLYVLLPEEAEYIPLTETIYTGILSGKFRF